MRTGTPRLSVLEPLELVSVRRFGRRLLVGVRDETSRRGLITFRLADNSAASAASRVVRAWLRGGVRLAYVRGGRESALFDVDALFARALV